MIQLPDGCWVDAKNVMEMRASVESGHVTIRMKSGLGHAVAPQYGEANVWDTAHRLLTEIRAEW